MSSQHQHLGYIRSCGPGGGKGVYSDDDAGSSQSDSTVLASRGVDAAGRRLAQRSQIDLGLRPNKVLCHPKIDYNSPSTHYLSPSLLNSPVTTCLEAFSPMLSPVRENKSVEESWRNDSFYLTPLPQTQEDNLDLYKKSVPRLSSPSQRRSLTCLPGAIGRKGDLSPSRFASQSLQSRSRGSNARNTTFPPLPYSSPSPMKRRGFVETLKSRGSSGLTDLIDDSLAGGSKDPRITRFKYSRTAFAGTILGQSSPGRMYGAPKLDAAHGNFHNLESRTPTPTGRVVDDRVVRKRHGSLEAGARSSYVSTKTSITTTAMTTASESSAITVTQQSRMDPSTPPNKLTTINICQNSGDMHSPHYDGLNFISERQDARFSTSPSPRSIPEINTESITERAIYQGGSLQREDSATSTIPSAAPNSTGDIPKPAAGIVSISSARRAPRAPKLIEVAQHDSGYSIVVPVCESHEKQRTVGDESARGAMYSMNSLSGEESTDIRPLVMSGIGKRIDPGISSHGSISKIPSAKNHTKRYSSYGNDLRDREAIRKDTEEYLDSARKRLEQTGEDVELGLMSRVGEVPEVMMANTPPKSVPISTGKKMTNKLLVGQQKITTTRSEHTGTASLGRNHRRISSNRFDGPNTGNIIRRSGTAGGTEKSYMRPLAKNLLSPPNKSHSSGTLSTISNQSSTRGGSSENKGTDQHLPNRKKNRSIDFSGRRGTPTAIGSKNGSKASITAAAAIDTPGKLAKKSMPQIIIPAADSPARFMNFSNGGVLVDITGIGRSSNPRTSPITTDRSWFGRRGTGFPTISRPVSNSGPVNDDAQKENCRPHIGTSEQCLKPQEVTPKRKSVTLGNLTNWLSSGRKPKGKSSPPPPNGRFSSEEVESLIKRLSTQIPMTPDQKNDFRVLGGRYYSLNIPSLDKSPSKDEKDRNPIAVCMDLINTAINEPQSAKRESLLQMSRVMVDIVSKSRDAECAAEEAKLAAGRAEMAFLETRKRLAEMTELVKHKGKEI